MPSFKVAHIREQGRDMLLFPLGGDIANRTDDERADVLRDLERRAHAAGLGGLAAIFWRTGSQGRFMGPQPWHPFLRSVTLSWVQARVNRTLSW